MSRGGSRWGGDRDDFSQQGADGWAVAGNGGPRVLPKAGDLSNFGKIEKKTPMTFGPSSVFAGKKEGKRESISRTSSSSNMFSMLRFTEPTAEAAKGKNESFVFCFCPSDSLSVPELPVQRKRLVLQPRSKPAAEDQDHRWTASASKSTAGEELLPLLF